MGVKCAGPWLSLCFSAFVTRSREIKKMKTLTIEEGGTQGLGGCLLNCQPEHLLPHHTGVQVRSYVLFLFLTVTQKVPWGRAQVLRLSCSSCSTFRDAEHAAGTQQKSCGGTVRDALNYFSFAFLYIPLRVVNRGVWRERVDIPSLIFKVAHFESLVREIFVKRGKNILNSFYCPPPHPTYQGGGPLWITA